jgi:YD repeat-containing protein
MRLYINGEQAGQMTSTRYAYEASPYYLQIGQFAIDYGITEYPGYFYGTLDEASIYDDDLSADQVEAHYLASAIGQSLLQSLGPAGFGISGLLGFALNAIGMVAEPVNTATGSYFTSAADLSLPGIGIPFALTRSYNSADETVGALGRGWTHSYGASLEVQANDDVVARAGSGQQLYFSKQPDGSFVAAAGGRATLTAVSGGYELLLADQTLYSFTSGGALSAITDRNGQGLSFSQGTYGPTEITDSAGRTITLSYNGSGQLTGVELPDERSVQYAYTGGLLTTVTDARGNDTTYTYDAGERLESITDQNGHVLVTNTYDGDGRVVEQVDARDNTSTFSWDAGTQVATFTDARGNEWTDYYSNNVLIAREDPLGNLTSFGYDEDLNLVSITDPLDNEITMSYDSAGNMLSRTTPAGTESWEYNEFNDPTSYTDGRDNTTSYGYDENGNLTSVTEPGSIVTEYGRDAQTGWLTSVTDPLSNTTSFDHDEDGNLAEIVSPLGLTTTMAYDGSGRMTSLVTPRGNEESGTPSEHTWSFGYDEANRMTSVSDPLGNETAYTFDDAGNLASVTDGNEHTTSYGYDEANHLTSVSDALTNTTSYGYDEVGNLTSRTDAETHATSYSYDEANRLTGVTSPTSQAWSYGYDAAGNRTSITLPSSDTIALGYDGVGRLASIDYSDSTPDVTFGYDENGNRTEMVDGAGSESYS